MGVIVTRNQPQGLVRIEWKNPVTRGLVLAYTPSAGLVNLVTGKTMTVAGSISPAVMSSGVAVLNAGSATSWIDTGVQISGLVSMSVLAVAVKDAAVSGTNVPSPIQAIGDSYNNSTNGWSLQYGNGYGSGAQIESPRLEQVYGGAQSGYGLWVDGVLQSATNPGGFGDNTISTGTTATVLASADGMQTDFNIRLMAGFWNQNYLQGRLALALVWLRSIPRGSAEGLSLSASPWQVFAAPPRAMLRNLLILRRALYLAP